MIRVLIVDDEQPARDRLKRLLAHVGDVTVVDEAEDGERAIAKAVEHRPDLLFLDIEMPGCGGLEVAASLPSPAPAVVFCTAFEEHAVDAFEVAAVDYLLKPATLTRVEKALDRVRARAAVRGAAGRTPPAAGGAPYPARFLARRGTRYHVVPARDVLAFVSEGGVTKLQAAGEHYWMEPTLLDLERRLDPARFQRVSRAAIVNLDAVREVVPLDGSQGEARLTGGTAVRVSRRRLEELMTRLREG
jgi:two-component system LytT family response regulator